LSGRIFDINFILVFVSRDFEVGRNVICEESTVSPVRWWYFVHLFPKKYLWGYL